MCVSVCLTVSVNGEHGMRRLAVGYLSFKLLAGLSCLHLGVCVCVRVSQSEE